VLEIGHRQGPAVAEILTAAGLTDVEIRQDLAGLDRIAVAIRP
jgi:methylase of polypeptide subunit release factors